MAENAMTPTQGNMPAPLIGLTQLSVAQQIGLLAGVAMAIAIVVVAVFWSLKPVNQVLFSGLADQDMLKVTELLAQASIPYEISTNGAIMVPADQVHNARFKAAAEGLPKGSVTGFEMLDKAQEFGTSQFIQNARFQRALEGELSRTISSLAHVQSARVHVAVPKRAVFLRDRKRPSASVFVNLYAGHQLDKTQIASIVHMVASSVPELDPKNVTVVDQKGRLLSADDSSDMMRMSANQFDYKRQLEDDYTKRIIDILSPIVGVEGVRAQVTSEIDFSVTEQTQESFNPDLPAVRSEKTLEETRQGAAAKGGVPGALANQPPEDATLAGQANEGGQQTGGANSSSTRSATRNFELDRTVSHVRHHSPSIRRLSIAVVVNDKTVVDEEGNVTPEPRSEQEIERITGLVKEAVGYDVQRGDSINVINSTFLVPEEPEPLPDIPFWEKPGMWEGIKQVLIAFAVIFAVFSVVRILKNLTEKGHTVVHNAQLEDFRKQVAESEANLALEGPEGAAGAAPTMSLPGPDIIDSQLDTAKELAQQDPKKVAQLVKSWVQEDG